MNVAYLICINKFFKNRVFYDNINSIIYIYMPFKQATNINAILIVFLHSLKNLLLDL